MKFPLLALLLTTSLLHADKVVYIAPKSHQKIVFTFEPDGDKRYHTLKYVKLGSNTFRVEDAELAEVGPHPCVEELDLDFDKHTDFAIMLRREHTGSHCLYLLWDQAKKCYINLGVWPELSYIAESNSWTGFEKGNEENAVELRVKNGQFVRVRRDPKTHRPLP